MSDTVSRKMSPKGDELRLACPDCGAILDIPWTYLREKQPVTSDGAGKWVNLSTGVKCGKCGSRFYSARDPEDEGVQNNNSAWWDNYSADNKDTEATKPKEEDKEEDKRVVACRHCGSKSTVAADNITAVKDGLAILKGKAQCPDCQEIEQSYELVDTKKANKLNVKDVFDAVNQLRSTMNASELEWNNRLAKAATHHALNMADFGEMSHVIDDSDTPELDDRVAKYGYNYKAGNVAEIIAHGIDTPEGLIKGWYNSRPHRAAMLHKQFKEAGVGVAAGDSNEIYACMVFGIPSYDTDRNNRRPRGNMWDKIRDFLI